MIRPEDLNEREVFDLTETGDFTTGDFDLERDFDTGEFDLERDFDTGDFETGEFDLELDFDTGDFDGERDFEAGDFEPLFFTTDDLKEVFFSILISFFFVTNL